MKFLIDAQLPYLLKSWLVQRGYDVAHTDDLPNRERTSDSELRALSRAENRIVITKDYDFVDSHLLHRNPERLLHISTGNLKNRTLLDLFRANWDQIEQLLLTYARVELTNHELIGHE
jgi:predicted nuclease of predicted toxin-antitoxin system